MSPNSVSKTVSQVGRTWLTGAKGRAVGYTTEGSEGAAIGTGEVGVVDGAARRGRSG